LVARVAVVQVVGTVEGFALVDAVASHGAGVQSEMVELVARVLSLLVAEVEWVG